MTSSYRPPTFQSSARPVDTFVRQSTVPLIEDDGFSQLTKALSAVNPILDMYMDRSIEEEKAEGMDIAIEQSFDGFKEISKEVGKKNGEEAARQLIGGSIFADRAYQKTKAQILANNLGNTLTNSYTTTVIDGKSLSEYSIDSPQYQNWLSDEREKVVEQLSDVKSIYVAEHFLPKLASATETISSHHIKEFKKIKVENIKSLAIPLVNNLIASPDNIDEELILNFETTINSLGLPAKDRSDINKTLVKVITESAEARGLSGNGDVDGSEDILAIAEKFPYGPGGKLNLTSHPEYQSKVNTLRRQVNDYVYKAEKRRELQKKRLQDQDIEQSVKEFIETGDPTILENKAKEYPFKAKDILSTGNVLDMDGRQSWAETRINIQSNVYGSKENSFNAAMNWFGTVENSQQNRILLKDLLDRADDVEKGLYTEILKGLTELKSELTGEFKNENFITSMTGQLNDRGSRKVTDLFNQAKNELYEYRTSEAGRQANTLELIQNIQKIKQKYIDKARELNPITLIESGLDSNNDTGTNDIKNNLEKNKQDMNDIEGDFEAGAATEVTDEEARQVIEAEDANQYLVQEGDTLTSIAEDLGTTVQKILEANNITNEDLINIGQQLNIPEINIKQPDINYSDDTRVQSIVKSAKQLGISPVDLAAVIAQESSFRPSVVSTDKATGKKYRGLIQFGPYEIAKYKIKSDMTFEEQMAAVTSFLKDRGVQPGHGPKEIYAAIFTGNVSNLDRGGADWPDSNGTTVNKALPNLLEGGSKYKMGIDFLQQTGTYAPKTN